MKPKRALKATTLNTDDLRSVSGGRGTVCGNLMHCSGCGYGWFADDSGSYGASCPSCGLGVDADSGGGGGGGGGDDGSAGGGGGGCDDMEACQQLCC